jgi:WhiB family redox-sensing transcriptional regulator
MTAELQGWRADGACKGSPTQWWFDVDRDGTRRAKRVCMGCLVRKQCLDYAIARRELCGIWGATTQHERDQVRLPSPRIPNPGLGRSVGRTRIH